MIEKRHVILTSGHNTYMCTHTNTEGDRERHRDTETETENWVLDFPPLLPKES